MNDPVLAVRKSDGARLLLPRHIVEMEDGLELAPSQRDADQRRTNAAAVRVTEPATTTITRTAKKEA